MRCTGVVLMFFLLPLLLCCNPKLSNGLRRNDLKRDVEMQTSEGLMVIRLSDLTPLHRDNFLKLVKDGFYDSIAFHRVIRNFMIQAGNPTSKPGYKITGLANTLPAEFSTTLFHKKGVIAAARTSDDVNPKKESSATQFYIVQGKIFTDAGLDSIETYRLNGRKLPMPQREVYKTIGGTPHLDQNYTIFGEVIKGQEVIDKIADQSTTGSQGADRPLNDIRILKAKLVKRK